jgi:biotin carboxyl carrier protein
VGEVPNSSQGIFLSYRREDAAPYARLLQFQLKDHFPNVRVFMDVDSIEPGLDFAQVIGEAVESCAILVVLIGRQWATLVDEDGHRRLDNPDDYVRFEVQTALERGIRVVPVLVDGARPLRQQQLPAELTKLARLNALELSYGRYQYDADRLFDLIQRVLDAAPVGNMSDRATRESARVVDRTDGRQTELKGSTDQPTAATGVERPGGAEVRFEVWVTMPRLGEGVTGGTVTRWLKREGERVAADEPLLEVSTDKVDTEIPSPAGGVLSSIVVGEDETAEVGSTLAVIETGSAPPAQPTAATRPTATSTDAGYVTPLVKTLSEKYGVDLAEIAGTGVGGRIRSQDVEEEAQRRGILPTAATGVERPGGAEVRFEVWVTMPRLGESVTEGTVTRWLKREGERVAADEPLLEVSTDKVDTEIPSPAGGVLSSIVVGEDETAEVGSTLAVIETGSGTASPARRGA